MEANQADVQFVAQLAEERVKVQVFTGEKEHFAVIPHGHVVSSLREFQFAEPPAIKEGAVKTQDVAGFSQYFARFADSDSLVFADPQKFTFDGVIDYHREGAGEAQRKRHKVNLTLQQTERWKVWHGANKQKKNQEAFAAFIEDNLADIYAPPDIPKMPEAATMLEVSRTLEATGSMTFAQKTDLQNGQRTLSYQEVVNGVAGHKSDLPIPDRFCIKVPVFLNQAATVVECRLRYRVSGGKLEMWFDMLRVDEMLAAEFGEARAAVEKACGRTAILGSA